MFAPVTTPLWLSAHVTIFVHVTMYFYIANLTDKPGNYWCIDLSMAIHNMLDQNFSAFKIKPTCVTYFSYDPVYCIHMLHKRHLVVGNLRTLWALMLILLLNVFIVFMNYYA